MRPGLSLFLDLRLRDGFLQGKQFASQFFHAGQEQRLQQILATFISRASN
jgi:hypothetical protein